MLRLNTFGGLVLQQDGQLHTGPASQRRRLALLAVIAAAGARGASRDKILSLLWPGSEPESARHSLYQAVHAIRRSAGSDEVFLGTTTLQLNPTLITSDVGEFAEAVESGAREQAVRLYRGPFLDGFRLENAPEYEQWQDAERARHARDCAAALESLAMAAADRGDHPAAVRWWRRLAAAEPVSTTAAVGLIAGAVASVPATSRRPSPPRPRPRGRASSPARRRAGRPWPASWRRSGAPSPGASRWASRPVRAPCSSPSPPATGVTPGRSSCTC
jgi:DNA-binding SARP family transcriptional activator